MKAAFIMSSKKRGQMEVNKLYSFVLLIVLVGMVIGVGILTLDKMGAATSYKRVDHNDTVTINAFNTTIKLDYGNLTKVSSVINATEEGSGVIGAANYTIHKLNGTIEMINQTDDIHPVSHLNFDIQVIYDWTDYRTETLTATRATSTEVALIATDWVGLIVTVFVLSLILFLVIRSFGPSIGQGRG